VLGRIKNGADVWGPEIEGMTMGSPDDLTREAVGDPLENARTFEADGLARQDAFLLKQAAQAYRSGGDQAKARECRARALEFEGRWREAGEAFFDAGFVPDAVRCLWRAGREGWRRLCDSLADFPQIQNEFEYEWARVAVHPGGPAEAAGLLSKLAARLENPELAQTYAGDSVWSDAVSAIVRPYLDPSAANHGDVPWHAFASSLARIKRAGVRVQPSVSAKVHFEAGRFAEAISLWNEAGETKSSAYQRAKVQVTPYPERITFLGNLELWEEIVSAYLAQPDTALTNEQAGVAVKALLKTGRHSEACDLAWTASLALSMLEVAVDAKRHGVEPCGRASLRAAMALLVRHAQWDVVSAFAESGAFHPSADWKVKDLKEWVKLESAGLHQMLIRALARSDALPDAPNTPLRRIQEHLRRYLNVKDGRWRAAVSVMEAGAALERAGRFTDGLQFYEAVAGWPIPPEEEAAARLRWIVCKQRHLDHERQRGSPAKVREIEREIRQALVDARVSTVEELPRYPVLPPLPSPLADIGAAVHGAAPAPAAIIGGGLSDRPVVIAKGGFKIELSARHRRCNITHLETMATAFVKCAERQCGGEVSFREDGDGVWTCDKWSITVRFPSGDGQPLLIESREFGTLVSEAL
jgi:tetratricopeptide (TPR) repeat protein